jgi:long-subunit fatty acid transport protein
VIDANQFPGEVNPVESELDLRSRVSGSDLFTPNLVLGAWYRPIPALELGLSAQIIPTSIRTHSTLEIEPLSPEIDDDVELRRDGEPANDVSLSLPLPLTARAGVRYRHLEGEVERFDVELDVAYESWSRVDRFSLRGDGLVANLLAQRVNVGTIDIEKQWRDVITVHLGGDALVLPQLLTLRGGVFYETGSMPAQYAHVDFAAGPQLGFALGASVFAADVELALAYEYRFQPELALSEGEARVQQQVPSSPCQPPFTDPDTCNPRYPGRQAPAVNAGTYDAHSHALSIDLLYRF